VTREFVRLEVHSGIGTIRLDRPPLNVLNLQAQDELASAAAEAAAAESVRAVILYGGPGVFAAGADVAEMAAMSHLDMVERAGPLQAAFTAVARIPKPVVAAINGYALGGGCELALCADVRFAGTSAVIGQPEILLGVIPGAGGTQRLARLVGPSIAKDLIFTGRQVRADEALAINVVNRVLPDESVFDEAVRWASQFVDGPARALQAAKSSIDDGIDTEMDAGLEIERREFGALFATEDRTLGMQSFLASGPGKAKFLGR
jgi:enoyl-CoA hydratase/carnithine racemase